GVGDLVPFSSAVSQAGVHSNPVTAADLVISSSWIPASSRNRRRLPARTVRKGTGKGRSGTVGAGAGAIGAGASGTSRLTRTNGSKERLAAILADRCDRVGGESPRNTPKCLPGPVGSVAYSRTTAYSFA